MTSSGDETPRPPATAEFGLVTAGGAVHRYPARDGVAVAKLSVGSFDNDVYVVTSDGEAVIVDGAAEPDRILAEVRGLRVRAIVQTHDHFDHVGALPALVDVLGAPVLAHPSDAMPVPSEAVGDGDRIRVGSAELVALHTPGHTPGSTCYLLGETLFTGDTLFPAGPGRTDGPGAFATIMRSLDRLFELPDGTRVCPGHGLDTTIGRERPYVEVWRRRGW